MAVPGVYRKSGEGSIASYTFTDIAEGTGVVKFYGAVTNAPAAAYMLAANPEYSSDIELDLQDAGTTTLNFDLAPFNLPKILTGTAYFSCGLYCGSLNDSVKVMVQLKKVSASTTDVSSEITSETYTGVTPDFGMVLLPLPLTKTHFKKGDILRLVVKFVKTGANATAYMGYDPIGRDGAQITAARGLTSQLTINVPFDLDL